MPALIVVDEWLLEDLFGKDDNKQEQALRFVYKLLKTSDKIVILHGSPFETKMFQMIKKSEKDTLLSQLSKFFHTGIVRNSSKTLFLDEEDLNPVPTKLMKLIPPDDQYLFLTHLNVNGSFILTSDGRWPVKLLQHRLVTVKMRDPFIKEYLSE